MTLTLLLDLDETLLLNPLDKFFPAYITALSTHLSPYIDSKRMVQQLLHATDLLIAKNNPCDSLERVFANDFYPSLGLQEAQLAQPIHDFYEGDYNKLKSITTPVSAARGLLDYARQNGYRVIIATNPLFPAIAVRKRLEWAEIPVSDYPYDLLTSYEVMHFSKPNPAYYAEILGQLGWPEGPVCMVGNSLTDDIIPAGKLDISCFWITDGNPDFQGHRPPFSAAGALNEVIPWLDRMASNVSLPKATDRDGIIAVLKSTPASLETLTNSCDRAHWRLHPVQGEWSLLEILCHLRDVEREVNLRRFETLSDKQNPFIPGVDSDRWAVERKYNEQDDTRVLSEICFNREKLLDIVSSYSQEEWHQPVRHSFFGSTTRLELAQFMAAHDRTHLQQMVRIIKAMK